MGSLLPTTGSLAEEIIRAVFMAAREDGRVRPVSSSELQGIEIAVSIPGPLKRIGGTAALSPARLGLMVRCGSRTALLLPGEAGSAEWQLDECRRKAGLPAGSRVEMFVFPAVTLTRSPERGREARR
jgi:AMMECR1 domain-containing protein